MGADNEGNVWGIALAVIVDVCEWVEKVAGSAWTTLGWPHAVLLMFCVGIYYFKDEIRGVIPRIKKVGADGFELDPILSPVQPDARKPPVSPQPAVDYPATLNVANDHLIKEIEGKSDEEKISYLFSNTAGWRVMWYFENIYSSIFGGQIQLLNMLNERGVTGLSNDIMQREWEEYKERFKPNIDNWELQVFLDFLKTKDLITQDADGIKITQHGKDFLVWLTKNGRPIAARPW